MVLIVFPIGVDRKVALCKIKPIRVGFMSAPVLGVFSVDKYDVRVESGIAVVIVPVL